MFIHIGKDIMVRSRDIIMILDYEKIKKSSQSQKFIRGLKNFEIEEHDVKELKTMIITTEKIYFSPITSATLAKRMIN